MDVDALVLVFSMVLGTGLSLVFNYFKPASLWFYSLPDKWRGLVMVGFVLVAAGIIAGASCSGITTWMVCNVDGFKTLLVAFILTLVSNQSTYMVTPESPTKTALKMAKAVEDSKLLTLDKPE